jgi:hypothetical protein
MSTLSGEAGGLPRDVKNWLVAQYLSDPNPEPLGSDDPEPVVLVPFDSLATFLLARGVDLLPSLDRWKAAGWIDDIMVTQPHGRGRFVGVRRAVLSAPSVSDDKAEARTQPSNCVNQADQVTVGTLLLAEFMSASDLAKSVGQPEKKVDQFLRQYLIAHPDCREKIERSRRGEARYVYRTREVWNALLERVKEWEQEAAG